LGKIEQRELTRDHLGTICCNSVTEAEHASGDSIWIMGQESTIAKGWRVDIYWDKGHYGAHIIGNGGHSSITQARTAISN
jgi:hypothetical protein